MDNSLLSIVVFLILTIIYFAVKYFKPSIARSAIVVYFVVTVLIQFGLNVNSTKELCGYSNVGMAFLVTFIPWIIIFGLLNVCLMMFPSWKSPFSNTIGYIVVWIAGIRQLLTDKILKKSVESDFTPGQMKGGSRSENEMLIESIQHIYSDPSLLVNEITPQNYDSFWQRMKPLFRRGAEDHKESLRKMVILKDIVSEAVWYMLGGGLITSISSNYIITKGCTRSVDQMKEMHEKHEKDEQKIHEIKEKQENRVYYTKD